MKEIVVISGVAGMTGSKIAEKYIEQNIPVVGFDNFFCGSRDVINRLKNNTNFTFFEYSINNTDKMTLLFDHVDNQYKDYRKIFINCAAVVHTKHFYEPYDTFDVNVLGMKLMLENSIKYNYHIFINCSTSEVYSMNSWKEGGVEETDSILLATAEQSLRTSYASGKLITEFFMKDAVDKQKIKGCSIRFANVYSPEENHNDHIIPWIISSLKNNNKVVLLNNAKETMRTFLHNEDSCDAVISLIKNEHALNGSIYNVGTMEEITILDLVKLIGSHMDIENPNITFEGERLSDPKRRLLNTSKINKATNWVPKIQLEDGIKQCIAFWRAQ